MNYEYIKYLVKKNRSGKIIKLLESNIHNWSLKDIFYIFTISKNLSYNYHVFYFMIETIYKCHNINFLYDYSSYSNYIRTLFVDSLDDGYYDIMKYLSKEKHDDFNFYFTNISSDNLERVNIYKYLIKHYTYGLEINYFSHICSNNNNKQFMEFYMSPYIRNISKSIKGTIMKNGFSNSVFSGNDETVKFLTSQYMYDIYPEIIDFNRCKQSLTRICNVFHSEYISKIKIKNILTHIFSNDVQKRYSELNISKFSDLKKIENIISHDI